MLNEIIEHKGIKIHHRQPRLKKFWGKYEWIADAVDENATSDYKIHWFSEEDENGMTKEWDSSHRIAEIYSLGGLTQR